MLKSAETTPPFPTTAADYDRDPYLLTVGNGTLGLQTGELRECRAEDLITRATDVPYFADAQCPRWKQFLEEIFDGNVQLIQFVQRAIGYGLTGITTENVLFILYGGGANGKTTFLEILLKLVGTHGVVTSFSTFLIHRNIGGPRNDIANLVGARLIKAAESQQDAALDEAVVKELTGSDTITARRLYGEPFSFQLSGKFFLSTNHKPTIRGADDAIWRRIKLIPFNRQFLGPNRDMNLRQKLETELSGILAWAVQGCLDWQRNGLGNVPVVEKATLTYRQESDRFGRFLSERCTTAPEDQAKGKELFDAYLEWCRENKERAESNNSFASALLERGIEKKRRGGGVLYTGVALRPR